MLLEDKVDHKRDEVTVLYNWLKGVVSSFFSSSNRQL